VQSWQRVPAPLFVVAQPFSQQYLCPWLKTKRAFHLCLPVSIYSPFCVLTSHKRAASTDNVTPP
jgi:hypothetical protein